MKYSKLLTLLVPVLTTALLELFYFYPRMLHAVIFLLLSLFVFVAWVFGKESNIKKPLVYAVLPTCFTGSLLAFTVLINIQYVQMFFVANVFFVFLYFRAVYFSIFEQEKYRSSSLENFSSFGNFIAFYFVASAIYGFQTFLDTKIWFLMLVLAVFVAVIVSQVMYTNKIDSAKWMLFVPVICLVLIELAWSFSFLTLSYYILGLVLAIDYYVLIGLTRFYLLAKLDARIIKLYISFGLLSVLVVLFTARWI